MVLRAVKIFFVGAVMLLVAGKNAYCQATMGSLDQNADQSQGQYMRMNMGYRNIPS